MNNGQKSLSINETFIVEGDNDGIISACTGIYTSAIISCFGDSQINMGTGVISTLSSFSATTFYGDGSNLTGVSKFDTFVTGGTYNDITGVATFTNNTGGTFNVTGFYTGSTDIYVTAVTFTNNQLTLFRNDGVTLGATINNFTNLNVNGSVSATTYYGDGSNLTGISTQDTFVTGGTYSAGTAVFTNNTGGTFSVTGFSNSTGTSFTGGTVLGATIFTNGLTANTFALSSTPSTNTTNTDVLTLNQSTGVIEQRSINSLTNVVNLVTVGLTGSTNVDYNSIKVAVDSITGASPTNTYVVKVGPGVFYEDPITMKSYVDVIGESETNTIIQANNPNTSLIIGADQSMVSDVQIQGCTGTNVAAVVYSSPTIPQLNAIFYVENVRFGANYTHAKTVGTGGGNCIMQCSNVKYGGYPFTLGFYVTNDGSGVGRMQLRNVTSTNGGVTTTSGLIFAKADKPNCAFIVNGCLLTKATGAAAGTAFWVEDGGSLRLTAVNFQRWLTGIYAPQVGAAPSIEAIALNFENCTTDVNVIHSGATGKIQGTDNYVKTLININAPLYEVNQDPRIITVAKKGGDFSSIKSAVDSITGSSSNNRFLVSVGPGRFSEGLIDLTGKPYVSIEGSNIITTEIIPSTNNQHIIKIGQNNELSFFSLSGAPSGYAGIYAYDIGDYGQAHKISFIDCDTNVWVESDTQDTIFFGEYLDFNGSYSYGTKVIANNGYVASANLENYYNFPTGTGTTIANRVQGSGATLSVFVGDGVGNGVTGSTNYEVFDYASLNTTTTTADGWDYCVKNPNIGGPVRFDIDSISVVNSIIYDISVEHPSTFGTFNGSASHVKINSLSNDVYWSFLDIDDGEFDITRKISVTFQDGTHTDASTLIFEGSTMGLIEGGVITHISGLTFQVSSGFGYLEKTIGNGIHMRIDWDDTEITLSADTENYLYFNENYILSTSSNAPDNTTNIILGRVVTDSTELRFIDVTPYNARHTSNLLSTFNRNALGPIYSNGSFVTENVTPYVLDVSSGDYYFSENNFLPSGGEGIKFTEYYRDGGTGWINDNITQVANGYDDNSGSIASLPLSSFTKHTLYVVGDGDNEQYMLVLGQDYYSTLVETEGADLPTPPTYFDDGVTSIASIVIQEGAPNIIEILDIRPVIGFKATGISATAVHGNLLGLNADDHQQYLLVDGSRAMSGNLSMGGNAISNALTVNGVTVETHASRHKNGGADEIATATPAPSEIPKADTFGKLDGWISDASTSVKGLTRLSQSPATATIPIAVGVNDPRFLNSITAVTNTSQSLVFTNVTAGTTTLSNIRINTLTANTISATTYLNLSILTSGTTIYSNNPSTNNFSNFNSIFLGQSAGQNATGATTSIFLGYQAGGNATTANGSNFIGTNAGLNATTSNFANFIGYYAGFGATGSQLSNFIGSQAGQDATGSNNSNFIGQQAGYLAANNISSNFIGNQAGFNTSGSSYSTLIGFKAGADLTSVNGIGSNNIIIGTNITLPSGSTNSINIGGVLFGSNTYSTTSGLAFSGAQTNGRIGINTNSPAYTLDVNGTSRVGGFSYSTSGTVIGTTATVAGIFPTGTPGTNGLAIRGGLFPSDAGTDIYLTNGQGNAANISSTRTIVELSRGFAPTSGTGNFTSMLINPLINQTGGANGVSRGLYINPTLTAAADFRAIETTVGNVILNSTSGNTLIGTSTNAGFKLDVSGTTRVKGTSLTSDVLFIQNSSGNNLLNLGAGSINGGLPSISSPQGSIYIYPNNSSLTNTFIFQTDGLHLGVGTSNVWGEGNQNYINLYQAGNGALRIITTVANNITFLTDNTERMRLFASTGNLAINTTSDAGFKLDVNGSTMVRTNLSVGLTGVGVSYDTGVGINIGSVGSGNGWKVNLMDNGGSGGGNIYGFFGWAGSILTDRNAAGRAVLTGPSAVLELQSTSKGFLPTRMTTAQKNAIASPATGLTVYDTTTLTPSFYNGVNWQNVIIPNSSGTTVISGNTIIQGGLTATTISATTYLNLPSVSTSFVFVTGNTTLSNVNQTVIVDSLTAITVTLPQITSNGTLITIKNINTGVETILPYSGQLIDGDTSVIVARQNVSLDFQSYNNNWYLI